MLIYKSNIASSTISVISIIKTNEGVTIQLNKNSSKYGHTHAIQSFKEISVKFCSECGGVCQQQIPDDDNRMRSVCRQCHMIHYENPKIICGCLPIFENKVLLCKRAIEPRLGLWTLPAGFMENQETLQEGAQRETWEEAHAKVDNISLYTVFNIPSINQVYMLFKGDLVDGKHAVGTESLATQLYEEEAIPWKEIAFLAIKKTLIHYFEDRKVGNFPVRIEDIIYQK